MISIQTTHICSRCKKKEIEDVRYKQCESCRDKASKQQRNWRAKDPQRYKDYLNNWNKNRRILALQHYGGKCACCQEETYEFLSIDHINGGGEKHRAEVGQGSNMVNWIINNNFPDMFRVLCHNCNQAIGYYGICPHQLT